jgi:hypothetical protein
MAIFTSKQLIIYTKRLELQKEILPLAPVFTVEQKEDMNNIYDKLLKICYTTIAKEKEVVEPTLL